MNDGFIHNLGRLQFVYNGGRVMKLYVLSGEGSGPSPKAYVHLREGEEPKSESEFVSRCESFVREINNSTVPL